MPAHLVYIHLESHQSAKMLNENYLSRFPFLELGKSYLLRFSIFFYGRSCSPTVTKKAKFRFILSRNHFFSYFVSRLKERPCLTEPWPVILNQTFLEILHFDATFEAQEASTCRVFDNLMPELF